MPYTIGRALGNNLVLNDPTISRRHAIIKREGAHYVIEDLGSQVGTLVNGKRIQSSPLHNGDTVTLGDTSLVFRM